MPDAKDDLLRPRPLEILALLPVAGILGVATGVSTNAVNVWLSPIYFTKQFPDWQGESDFQVWLSSLNQGAFEGALNGLGVGLVFLFGVGIISKLRCPFRVAVKIQPKIVISLIFSCAFGLNGALLALLLPQFFNLFYGLPNGLWPLLRFGWVSGSLIGISFGGVLGTIMGLTSFAPKWRQLEKDALSSRETA